MYDITYLCFSKHVHFRALYNNVKINNIYWTVYSNKYERR